MADDTQAGREATVVPAGGAASPGARDSFLDVLSLFVRTIPIYADDHSRTVAATERLQLALSERGFATVIEATDVGLRLDGEEHSDLASGPAALRDSLVRTGIARITFSAGAPTASFVAFARSLQRNARLRQSSALTFGDLWMAPIEGILVEEQRFSREDFAGGKGDGYAAGAQAFGAPRRRAADPDAVTDAAGFRDPVARPPPLRPSCGLRDVALEDDQVTDLLAKIGAILARRSASLGNHRNGDVLDHVLAALPLEARLDFTRGVGLLRRVLENLRTALEENDAGESERPAAALLRAIGSVFPERVVPEADATADVSFTNDPDDVPAEAADALEDLRWAGDGPAPPLVPPRLDGAEGIRDLAGILTHAVLEETEGARRDTLREQLVSRLEARPTNEPVPCVLSHLREAAYEAAPVRDRSRARLLGAIVDDSRLDVRSAFPTGLDPDVVVAAFPSLLATFVARGGSAGYVAARVGRAAVLAAADVLTGAAGVLRREELVQRILAERKRDALPFVEILCADEHSLRRKAVIACVRRTDIACAAAAAVRIVADERLPVSLLRVLCEDGFAGVDSHRADQVAIAEITAVADGRGVAVDAHARAYATSALGGFARKLVGPTVKRLGSRRLLVLAAPKPVRRAAAAVLRRWRQEDAGGVQTASAVADGRKSEQPITHPDVTEPVVPPLELPR